ATLCPLRVPVHPAQLYEAFLDLGVVFAALSFWKTRKSYDGQLFLVYFCLAGAVRFVVEFFRSPLDYRGPTYFGWMPLTQLIALCMALVAGALLVWFGWRSRSRLQGGHK
ncbi:MAG: prolipoprotein diacylglyceryl transferase family protein, partial [Desulfobaccales bacterium]